tara:strand:+ start:477 stop:626 length:150 start_codon:yes stop_codon:yes gene_type:complete
MRIGLNVFSPLNSFKPWAGLGSRFQPSNLSADAFRLRPCGGKEISLLLS